MFLTTSNLTHLLVENLMICWELENSVRTVQTLNRIVRVCRRWEGCKGEGKEVGGLEKRINWERVRKRVEIMTFKFDSEEFSEAAEVFEELFNE